MEIKHFSLYREKLVIDLDFGDGVFCLAGANGLGKSTFLAILNYAITGIVANPERKFMSLPEYYKDSLKYSNEYFGGRVMELERHLAEVTITLTVGSVNYTLTRGIFEPQALRRLTISGSKTVGVDSAVDSADENAASELHSVYARSIVEHCNLANFDQLVFLQHFLLTFDERRLLLFWDPDLAQQALFLAFGVDGERARQADEWRRTADRLESQARNAQYQATTARQRKEELLGRTDDTDRLDPDLLLIHTELVEVRDKVEMLRDAKSRDVSDAQLALTRATARRQALTSDYDRAFNSRLRPGANPQQHSLVNNLLHHHRCGICGASGPGIELAALELADSEKCPLCHSSTSQLSPTAKDFSHLEELDEQLSFVTKQVDVAQQTVARLAAEFENCERDYISSKEALVDFEKKNDISSRDTEQVPAGNALGEIIKQLDGEREAAIERRNDFRRRRDEFRAQLEPVQRELSTKYSKAEVDFVPRFQKLAYQFLGLDLRVNMELKARGAELALEIGGTRRRMTTQLSESQRYFVDIALRMALAQHMVGIDNPACLYIDTPEGSLDIAYESRAGQMFGRFVTDGNKLVITANINSSKLVQQLARICGSQLMKIERMTDWAILSEVQAESEALFDEAYHEITNALHGNTAP
jgi:DNA repair exonuclease SbcCD ATPase subunit